MEPLKKRSRLKICFEAASFLKIELGYTSNSGFAKLLFVQ